MNRLIFKLLKKFTRLKLLKPKHATQLSYIHTRSFPIGWNADDLALMLGDTNVHGTGIFLFKLLIGFILIRAVAGEAEVLTIATHPIARGVGIGKILLHQGCISATRHQATTMFLEVAVNNSHALKLYTHAGFQEVGRRKAYYQTAGQPAQDALILQRPLEALPYYVHGYAENL